MGRRQRARSPCACGVRLRLLSQLVVGALLLAALPLAGAQAAPLASLSIGDATVIEGNSGVTRALFTVTLKHGNGTERVRYTTVAGTAKADDDFVAVSGILIFKGGQAEKEIRVPVLGDTAFEPDETFAVRLSHASHASIASRLGEGTIRDDDDDNGGGGGQPPPPPSPALPDLSIVDATVTEGNSGGTNAVFTVTLSAASATTVTVDYATANGTAVAPGDYTSTSGTLSFSPGQTIKQITVVVNGDTAAEPTETFSVNLSGASGANIADGAGTGTIIDDDSASLTLSIGDSTVTEGNSGTTNASFNVILSGANTGTVTVDYATADGSAVAPGDYTSTSGTLSFSPGQTIKQVLVPVVGDMAIEANENFTLNLSNANGATITDGVGIGTINDNDTPSLSINSVSVTEGNTGTVNAVFTVTLSASSTSTVTVDYATADGSAVAPGDYTSTSGTLSFAAGQVTKQVTVPVVGDTVAEANETFSVNLSNPMNATISGSGFGTGTINDNDTPSLSINSVSVTEGNTGTRNLVFTVTLSAASGNTVTVDFATANGSAGAPGDYIATSGTVTFNPGEVAKQITVQVVGDTVVEANETFSVNLSNPTNATISGSGFGTGTINNDD